MLVLDTVESNYNPLSKGNYYRRGHTLDFYLDLLYNLEDEVAGPFAGHSCSI